MTNPTSLQPTASRPQLYHVQTKIVFKFPDHASVIHIGKPNDTIPPDIDVSSLPSSDVVSRVHAKIRAQGNNYFIEDAGSSNGTFLNNTRLEPRIRYQLNMEDRIDLGQPGHVTFLFQALQNISAPVNTDHSGKDEKESQISILTKLIGLVFMLAGLEFLSSSLIIGAHGLIYNTPLVVLGIAGVLVLNYGGSNRNLGWVLIAIGIAIAIASGGIIIVPMTLFAFLLATGAFSVGYQLFNSGKILNFNLLSLQGILGK